MFVVNQHSALSKPTPWYYQNAKKLSNPQMIYFPDEFEKIKNKDQIKPVNEVEYGPTIPNHINHMDYLPRQPDVVDVEVGERGTLISPTWCPSGTVYYHGKCKKLHKG